MPPTTSFKTSEALRSLFVKYGLPEQTAIHLWKNLPTLWARTHKTTQVQKNIRDCCWQYLNLREKRMKINAEKERKRIEIEEKRVWPATWIGNMAYDSANDNSSFSRIFTTLIITCKDMHHHHCLWVDIAVLAIHITHMIISQFKMV